MRQAFYKKIILIEPVAIIPGLRGKPAMTSYGLQKR